MTFLTEAELVTLTKRKQPAARIRVLKKQGVAFKLDGNGHPVVAWASVNAVSGKVARKSGPNHEALQRLMQHGTSSIQRPRTAPTCDVLPAGTPSSAKGQRR